MNGVGEVYIYCGSHTEQVEDYVARSRWSTSSKSCPFSVVQFVRVADARSVGDVLRDMDKRSLVDGDFLLVHGDLVSNMMLDSVLEAHRKRREENAANIMTCVLRSGGLEEHRTKTNGITPVFVVDSTTQRCLHYDEIQPLSSDHYLSLDPAITDELSTDFEIRADLIDAQIDICTPEVLALWSESFDYELPRRNFLHGVLKDWELNGKQIYAAILEDGYAARASNLQMYDSISQDVLSRWTFPFIPENNLVPSQSYTRRASGVVIEDSAFYAPNAKVSNSIIGKYTTIGAGSKVKNCIVGKDCKIGDNVTLDGCFIWNDTSIESGAKVSKAILADSVCISKNTVVNKGALLSFGVQVSENTTVPPHASLSTVNVNNESITKNVELFGSTTNAGVFVDPDDEELDEEDPARLQKSLIYSLADLNLSTSTISTLDSAIDSDDEEAVGFGPGSSTRSRLSSFASDDSAGRSGFHTDAVNGLVDALRADSGDFDSAKLEFMGLRLANDASDAMMRKAVATAFARRAAELTTAEHGSLEASKAAGEALTSKRGATRFVSEVGVGGGEAEQVAFVLDLQRALRHVRGVEAGRAGTLLAALMQQLYALDILEEEGILAWWSDERAQDGEGMAAIKEKCRVLVEWLENASEEGSDDDDDDDDDDDE